MRHTPNNTQAKVKERKGHEGIKNKARKLIVKLEVYGKRAGSGIRWVDEESG